MIKTLIFDNNGVLTTSDAENVLADVAALFSLPVQDFEKIYLEASQPLDDGSITTDDFYNRLLEKTGKKLDKKVLKETHLKGYKPKKEIQEYIKKLNELYQLALLTNFGDYFDEANEYWGLAEIFPSERMFVSAKLRMRKPNEEIYRYVIENLGGDPAEMVFIDDKIENLIPAQKLGMKTIHFKGLESLIEGIKEFEAEYVER